MKHARKTISSDILHLGRPPMRVFTTKDGLPQNTIQATGVDSRGYLWVGSQDGAARYNGRNWLAVPMPNHTRSNFVGALTPSADGSIWFGTNGGGVCRLYHGQWKVYTTESGEISNDQVRCMLETPGATGTPVLWIGTRNGLVRHEAGRWKTLGEEAGLPGPVVRSLLRTVDASGTASLWVGTREGLVRMRRDGWTVFGTSDGLPHGTVTCLLETEEPGGAKVLWCGTEGGGLGIHRDGTWTVVDESAGLPDDRVRCLAETRAADGSRVLWAGTDGGLGRYEHGRWTRFDTSSGLPHNVVLSLEPDGGAVTTALWAGTMGGGVARIDLGRWLALDTSAGLPSNSVWSVLETDEPGTGRAYWFGTLDGGLARHAAGEWTVFDTSTGLPDNFVLSLLETRDVSGERTIWAGTVAGGLARLERGAWTVYDTTSGLPHNTVLDLAETGAGTRDRALWVATNGGGLARLREGTWDVFDTDSGIPNNVVSCLAETRSTAGRSVLWAGTNGGGLGRYADGEWSVVDTRSGLPNDLVMGLFEARGPKGRRELWVGTHGGGVAWMDLDAKTHEWRSLSSASAPAISSDVVYQIRQDAAGRIYLFTNRGIDRLTRRTPTKDDPAEFAVYTFTSDDGLPSSECNSSAALVDSHGRVWAGTGDGAAVLDPSREIESAEPKTIRVERARIAGRANDLERGETLAHDENNIVFEYALLSFFRERATRYRTQLVGFDRRPSDWTPDWKRGYTNLPEGEYTFEVWGRDYAGNVSGPATMKFRVRPAPWRTWWAYGLYAGSAAGIAYAGIRYRLEALKRRNVELEAAIAERTAQLAENVLELQRSERRALDSERRALDANRAKSVFLSSMSHELRTPLNAILGFVQVMQHNAERDAEDRENLEIISRSGEHLLGLINDVLSISKIEAGKISLNEQPFDLKLLLRGIEEMIRVRAEGKGLALVVELDQDVPRYVRGDEGKLRQVLINLLGNAVKFTETGGVVLRVAWRDGRGSFVVEDTGHGIAEDEIGKLFQPFQQTESGQKAHEGTGLGLAISRNFVTLMGGDIAVNSTLGQGTTFAFDVSLPESDGPETRESTRRIVGLELGQPVFRLLVVDDTAVNRLLLRKIVEPLGFQVREAANGLEAVEIWERWDPQLIWMDSRLPVMSGLDAIAEIRRREAAAAGDTRTRIVALTASAFDHDREAFLEAGCDGFVAKPYRESEILDALVTHLGARFRYETVGSEQADGSPEIELTPERLTGLVAEDLASLNQAAIQGDLEAAYGTIERVRAYDDALADELHALVRGYRFDDLLQLIEGATA